MEMKKALVLVALLGVFASGFGAESTSEVKPALLPPSMKLLMKGAEAVAIEEDPRDTLEKRSAELKKSGKNSPLNVILLLVDELYRSGATAFLENQDEFPVHGVLETCPAVNDHSVVGNCDCDEKLGSNIASLISWAQRVNMSTSGVYELSTSVSDPRARLIYRQRREAPWLLQIKPSPDNEKAKVASKLKDTFFRSLVNGMNIAQLREPSVIYRSDVGELTSNVLKELNLNPNQHGHLAVVRTGVDGLGDILQLLKRYVSPSNTLTVVTNSCPQDRYNLVPFFAGGFGSEHLSHGANLKLLHDLPIAIRTIVDQHKMINMENVKPEIIFALDASDVSIAPADRIVRSIYYDDHQRKKRDEAPAENPSARQDDVSSQEAITQSTMMIVTVVTATITYTLKF